MKRAFSMTELQAAIEPYRTMEEPLTENNFTSTILRRSKSLDSLQMSLPFMIKSGNEKCSESNLESVQAILPPLSSLGLSFSQEVVNSHGFEELKRC
jgi:hypothetical protein